MQSHSVVGVVGGRILNTKLPLKLQWLLILTNKKVTRDVKRGLYCKEIYSIILWEQNYENLGTIENGQWLSSPVPNKFLNFSPKS